MSKLKEVRQNKLELENKIKDLLIDFINKNGSCEISINVEQTFIKAKDETEKVFVGIGVEIDVKI